MEGQKGQVSAEFASVLAIQLLIIALLMVIFISVISQIGLRSQHVIVQESVFAVADAARLVWETGPGSGKLVQINIPEAADLGQSYIRNNTIDIYMQNFGDVSAAVPFQINGNWPSQIGNGFVEVLHNGTQVIVRPAAYIDINASAVYVNYNKTSSALNSTKLRVTNRMNNTYNFTIRYSSCSSSISCAIVPFSNASLAPFASYEFNVTINAAGYNAGLYGGIVNFTMVSNASYNPNASYAIPIGARIFT